MLTLAPVALAGSEGWPYRWWDGDNTQPVAHSDRTRHFDDAGGSWTTAALNRLTEATNEWDTDTLWAPDRVARGNSPNNIYIDNTSPPCLPNAWDTPGLTYYAVTCNDIVHYFPGEIDSWIDINGTDLYFNREDISWDFSNAGWDENDQNASFEGVLVHELGHAGGLRHEAVAANCPPGATMCGSGGYYYTWNQTTLTSDDKSSMNTLYP